ncbi:MAG: replicative DNA helicase [Parcubacteria group bacterium]|nr:replicative DNA helicase [Parcubacteria group bacterium]
MAQKTHSGFRIPPQSIESERALLGSIMLRPEVLYDIMDVLNEDSFYAEKHRLTFRSMLDLFSKHEPIDLLSLSTRLKERNLLDNIGGNSYLAELVNSVPSSANAKHYADVVQKKHVLRNLIDASNRVSEMGYNEGEELEYILDKSEKEVFGVTSMLSNQKFMPIKDTLNGAWERLEHLHNSKEEIRGVRTGFHAIDTKLAGFQKSDLIILAARPSMGKTSLALDIARQTALEHKTPICFFSLEMSAQQLVDRMLSSESRVDSWKIRTGKISSDEEFSQIRDALGRLSQAPIFIDDQSSNNIMRMRSTARRIKSEHGLGLIVIDYLQLMVPSRASDSTVQQVTEISRSLKGLARELDVPVLALSQLSRAVEQRGGRPRLSDLRDSGAIEQDADVVMFIHREQKEDGGGRNQTAEILIEKHRNGPTGKVDLYFDEQKTTFLNIDNNMAPAGGGGSSGGMDDFSNF